MPGPQNGNQAVYDTTLLGGAGAHRITLLATSLEGCVNRDSVLVTFNDCTAIPEPGTAAESVYPNPSDGQFYLIPSETTDREVTLEVANGSGQVVRTLRASLQPGKPVKIDLSVLPDDVYLLSFPTARGTATCKLILRR
jgi:hypothetical protein